MSKERSIEKHIDHARALLLGFLAIDVSLVAWLANAMILWPETRWSLMTLGFVGFAMISLVVITAFLFRLDRLVMRLIRQLESL